jgi:phosphotransferase system HPr-like phosphotransfer protein
MAKLTATVTKDFTINEITTAVNIAGVSIKTVSIQKATTTVDVKSILGLSTLGLRRGDVVVLESEDANVLTLLANYL